MFVLMENFRDYIGIAKILQVIQIKEIWVYYSKDKIIIYLLGLRSTSDTVRSTSDTVWANESGDQIIFKRRKAATHESPLKIIHWSWLFEAHNIVSS